MKKKSKISNIKSFATRQNGRHRQQCDLKMNMGYNKIVQLWKTTFNKLLLPRDKNNIQHLKKRKYTPENKNIKRFSCLNERKINNNYTYFKRNAFHIIPENRHHLFNLYSKHAVFIFAFADSKYISFSIGMWYPSQVWISFLIVFCVCLHLHPDSGSNSRSIHLFEIIFKEKC